MLPSDIARLVLVYLKDEGLTGSYKRFFSESPHLEELRQHPDVEPSVPYEKGLPEILNEYAKIISAVKDRMNCNQLVNSLWKMHSEVIGQLRFQYTGNVGLLQTPSPEQRCVTQGTLTRYRISGLRKQQELQRKLAAQLTNSASSVPNTPHSTNPAHSAAINSVHSAAANSTHSSVVNLAHSMMTSGSAANSVSVPMSPIDANSSPMVSGNHLPSSLDAASMNRAQSTSPDMEVEIQVSDREQVGQGLRELQDLQETVDIPELRTPVKNHSLAETQLDTPIGKSPKRKSAAPRRIQTTTAATVSPRSDTASSVAPWEDEVRDLPQVLESLINNIEFQEKLAGNINKARPVENLDRVARAEPVSEADSTHNPSSQSTSIEDLLNLHMSDDTIHEIVQKTSSDPAFESLFTLFNNDKDKFSQNSDDGRSQQLGGIDPTGDAHTGSSDIMADPSPIPDVPVSNQSHCPSDQEVGEMIQSPASQNAREVAPVCEPPGSSGAVSANTVAITTGANTGQQRSIDPQPAITSMPVGASLQVPAPQLTTSSVPPQVTINQSADQILTLPVVLNQPQQCQVLQQPNTANPQNIVLNNLGNLSGGTIFMLPDGRILGTSGVVLQNGQPQQQTGPQPSLVISQAGTQEVISGVESVGNATPSDICPVHGRKVSDARMSMTSASQAVALNTSGTSPVAPPTVTQTNSTQESRGHSEAVQLLGSMVESDVGSLLLNYSPENTQSGSPPTSERPFQGVGSNSRGARLSTTPSLSGQQGSGTVTNNNQSNSHNKVPESQPKSQGTHFREKAAMTQPNQGTSDSRNIFSAIGNERVVLNPVPATGSQVPQVLSTSVASQPTVSLTPVNTVKQRKHIQFKEPVLSRTLDVGGTWESQPKPRGRPAKPTKQPKAPAKTKSRGQSAKANSAAQNKLVSSDLVSRQSAATVTVELEELTNIPKPASQPTVRTKVTPDKVQRVPDDMSAKVDIAAQMLVCLSNSPPSLRQSPLRQQRLRQNSGGSPARSPSRDRVVELRKEIGLNPSNKHPQQKDRTSGALATLKSSLVQTRHVEIPKDVMEADNHETRTQATTSQQPSVAQKKDALSSKRKSRTPRKQTHTVTETVVLTLPSESNQKSKTPVPSSIQTRASMQKAKSPGKVLEDQVATRKSINRTCKSPGRPATSNAGGVDWAKGDAENSAEDAGKKENRGQKRSRESNKEEKNKKPKTAKNPKNKKKCQGFPSNLDVDKFLSSLQYAE